MKHAFIFHGTAGKATGNWFPWLKSELRPIGYETIVPQFPTPEGQSLESWLSVLQPHMHLINEDTLLIGHSLGGLFLLRVLERMAHPVQAVFFVAAPIGVRPIKYYESDEAFSGFTFQWNTIRKSAKRFAVFHSDNDPYVSLANGEQLARELGVPLHFIPQAGHLNAESGYTTLEPLLKSIIEITGSGSV